MFLKKLTIENFRVFNGCFDVNLNVPDGENEGSGLNIIVGVNGSGKTTILESINLLTSNALFRNLGLDDFIVDMLNINENAFKEIKISGETDESFDVKRLWGNNKFNCYGFQLTANARKKSGKLFNEPFVSDTNYLTNEPLKNGKSKGLSPIELRQSATDAFNMPRHKDIEIFYFGKNRTYHLYNGDYKTKLSAITSELNYRFNSLNKEVISSLKNQFYEVKNSLDKEKVNDLNILNNVNNIIKQFGIDGISIEILNHTEPYLNAFISTIKSGNQIAVNKIGSGTECLIAIILLVELAKSSNIDIILCIDEPEIHLHPQYQKTFFDYLTDLATNSQVIISTHSEIFSNIVNYKNIIKINRELTPKIFNGAEANLDFIEDRKRFYKRHRSLFFQEFAIFVEGKDDIERYKWFCSTNPELNHLENYFVEMNGCDDIDFWDKFCKTFGITSIFIADEDYLYERPYGARESQKRNFRQVAKILESKLSTTLSQVEIEKYLTNCTNNKTLKKDMQRETIGDLNKIINKNVLVLKAGEVSDYIINKNKVFEIVEDRKAELVAIFNYIKNIIEPNIDSSDKNDDIVTEIYKNVQTDDNKVPESLF